YSPHRKEGNPMPLTRRRFVFGIGVAGAGALLAACSSASPTAVPPTAAPAKPAEAPKPTEAPKPAAAAPEPTKPAAAAPAPTPAPAPAPTTAPAAAAAPAKTGGVPEIIHWSSLTASDGEVWEVVIQNANKANEGKWVIKKDTVADAIDAKTLAAVA